VESPQIIERTFQAKEKADQVFVDRSPMEYLYRDGQLFHFMDPETYEQVALEEEVLVTALPFLKENMTVRFKTLEGRVIGVDMPDTVDLEITETEPGLRGDTVSGSTKPAILETGHVVQVPLFIETGEVVRVNTRTGDYLGRAGS
jgi:elongation factor P